MSREMKGCRRAVAVAAAVGCFAMAGAASGRGPNILLIDADDHAQWALGAYGNKEIHTPNMDRLAREGMRFTQAFTKPVCSPSRAMMLTGQYSHRVGIPDYIPFGNPVYVDMGLPADTTTIAKVLKDAGYRTGLVGKWHLGYGEKYYPTLFGFDLAEGYRYVEKGPRPDRLGPVPIVIDNRKWPRFRSDVRLTDVLTDRAIRFVRDNRGTPFFLFLNYYRPHLPWLPVPEEDMAHYQGKKLTIPDMQRFPEVAVDEEPLQEMYRQYYANISSVDRNLGRLLAELETLGLQGDTVVLFVGDNGFNVGQHGLLGKGNARILGTKRRRPNMFDRSVLVPLIVRWPGVVRPGSTSDALVSTIDFFPTFADMARTKPTESLQLDGASMMPLLREKSGAPWRDAYCDTYDMTFLDEARMRMIRTDEWKLVLYCNADTPSAPNQKRHELFHLTDDPEELSNLYGKESAKPIQEQLEARLRAWMRETGVPGE